ncbi:MAG: hypothetical protein JXA41_11775 [Deltaproteobacteria bacterium]|nr:hypothetical protein [Deltaproteobacteria bacterium]
MKNQIFDLGCPQLRRQWWSRIFVLIGALIFFSSIGIAQETMQFDSEAEKLEFVRQMLQMLLKEKYLRPGYDEPEPFCELMIKDLLEGKNFKAIEPDVRADSADDPRLDKWKKCKNEIISPLGIHSLNALGGPPYRYYKIELDGNQDNGPEDMIYYNMYREKINGKKEATFGRTGYVWVDGCETKRTFHIAGALEMRPRKANAVYLNTLVYYKGQLWAMEFLMGLVFHFSIGMTTSWTHVFGFFMNLRNKTIS